MFRFSKKMFTVVIEFIGLNANANPLKFVSMRYQECKIRSAIMNINSNEPLFYLYSVLVNKCSGICNDINNPYAKFCVPDDVKDMNTKVLNLMSRNNEIRHVTCHETCGCK